MLDILRLISRVEPIEILLEKIVGTIAETFKIKTVSLGMLDDSTGFFIPRALHGFPPDKASAIKKHAYTLDRMKSDLRDEFKIGRNSYYVRFEDQESAYDDSMDYILNPGLIEGVRSSPSQWHELDYIDFVMTDRLGNWIGWIEIDEPIDGVVPSKDVIDRIQILSDLAAIAMENSKIYEEAVDAMKDSQSYLDLIIHDIGNMVDPIVYYINCMLASKNLTEREVSQCMNAIAVARSMRTLVDSVKKTSEIKSSETTPKQKYVLRDVLDNCALSVQRTFPDRDIRISLQSPPRNIEVIADSLVYELFINLLNNAVKYTPRREVDIDLSISESNDGCTVSVGDHGIGVPDDRKERIFQRFSKRPAGMPGTGLGLSIASLLADRYGGIVSVRDRVQGDYSQGCCFDVVFPKVPDATNVPQPGRRSIDNNNIMTGRTMPPASRKA
jgi:signal transduction histidine kinase